MKSNVLEGYRTLINGRVNSCSYGPPGEVEVTCSREEVPTINHVILHGVVRVGGVGCVYLVRVRDLDMNNANT